METKMIKEANMTVDLSSSEDLCVPNSPCSNMPVERNESTKNNLYGQNLNLIDYNWIVNWIPQAILIAIALYIISKCVTKSSKAIYVCEVLFSLFIFIIAAPIALPIIFLTIIFRRVLNFYFERKYDGKVRLMDGNDAFWAYDEFANCSYFMGLYVMEGIGDIPKIRNHLLNNVINKLQEGEEVYLRLRSQATKKFGFYCWEKLDILHENFHIRGIRNNDADNMPMTETEVFQEISKFYDYPMSKGKPQWEILIVPNYVYDDKKAMEGNKRYYALLFRIHHSYMDGISASFILQYGIADNQPKLSVDPLAPIKIPLLKRIVGSVALVFLGPRSLVKALLLNESNCFHGKELSGPKTLAWSKPVSLKSLKAIKENTKTSTTAILVASLGGSLRRLAIKKKLEVPRRIHAFPTVAILPYPNTKPQNRFTVTLFPIEIGLNTSIERLQSAYKSACQLARSPDVLFGYLTMKVTGILPYIATKFISDTAHATMLLTNVPGPSEPMFLFNGDMLVDVGIWAPIRSKVGIGMGLFSYNGQVRASMIGDANCISDIPQLVKEFEEEINELSKHAQLSDV